jgi:O-antigen/teichoic acid export membrane protein
LYKIIVLNPIKRLVTDTAIYGVSSIVGRFINWWLVPYHAGIFNPEEYGVVSNLYSYVAFAMILLTYGMETGFFRFASKSENSEKIYSTSFISLLFTSLVFLLSVRIFREDLSVAMKYPGQSEFIWWLAITVCLDAITAIPFAKLRLTGRPIKFASIKIINIFLNIGFNVFFLSVCPWILKNHPGTLFMRLYNPELGVGYIFLANLLASLSTLILLYKEIFHIKPVFDKALLLKMLAYSLPILVIGLAGMINQNIDKILIPFLLPADHNPMYQLGIYGANYKLAVLMNMFIQAFRYSFEPFFFNRNKKETEDNPMIYATVMKYFIIFGLLIFLGMVLNIDIVKHIIPFKYQDGIRVVPIILIADLFFGVFFSASIWYKLKDRTWYGAYIALIGAAITLVLNIVLIPVWGYMGSAVSLLVCYFTMMIINYFWGQKFYPIPYDLKRIVVYFIVSLLLYSISFFYSGIPPILKFLLNNILLIGFLFFVFMREKSELIRLLKKNKG